MLALTNTKRKKKTGSKSLDLIRGVIREEQRGETEDLTIFPAVTSTFSTWHTVRI